MAKIKGIVSYVLLSFLSIFFLVGLSDFISTGETIDLFILFIIAVAMIPPARGAFKYRKSMRNKKNEIKEIPEQTIPVSAPTKIGENVKSQDYDCMNGHEFEHFCADVLRGNEFYNVEVTRGSGDHGIDILAEKDGVSYAVQCKCYSKNIGNSAIQQAHTGKSIYHKDIAVVMTNRYFTPQAKEEAGQLGVKLWDRDTLNIMIGKM